MAVFCLPVVVVRCHVDGCVVPACRRLQLVTNFSLCAAPVSNLDVANFVSTVAGSFMVRCLPVTPPPPPCICRRGCFCCWYHHPHTHRHRLTRHLSLPLSTVAFQRSLLRPMPPTHAIHLCVICPCPVPFPTHPYVIFYRVWSSTTRTTEPSRELRTLTSPWMLWCVQ